MKNEIYEADYTREPDPDEGLGILGLAMDTGFFKAYDDLMRSMPKYIVPEDKKNYEELLPKLDALAKRKGGKIKGIVSYEHWDAHIYITLSHFEFVHKDDCELLKELQAKAHALTFSPTDDGRIRLSVAINYFEEIGDKDEVFSKALEGNDELIGVLTARIESQKQSILEHPTLGKVIELAAHNLGISAQELVDEAFEDDGSDPKRKLQMITALIEAKEELTDSEE